MNKTFYVQCWKVEKLLQVCSVTILIYFESCDVCWTHGEEAGWMYWEAGEFVRKWCYTLLSAGEESCILSECQQCIVHTMKRRWGNYFLARHKTSIRSLASSTHTQQYTLQSVTQILYIVMYERRSEDPWLSGDLIWVPQPLSWTSIPRKMTHFKSTAFLVKMCPLSIHTY